MLLDLTCCFVEFPLSCYLKDNVTRTVVVVVLLFFFSFRNFGVVFLSFQVRTCKYSGTCILVYFLMADYARSDSHFSSDGNVRLQVQGNRLRHDVCQ